MLVLPVTFLFPANYRHFWYIVYSKAADLALRLVVHSTAILEMGWHGDVPPLSSQWPRDWLHSVLDEFHTIIMGTAWHWHWSTHHNYPVIWGPMWVAGCRIGGGMWREWEIMLISQPGPNLASPNLRAALTGWKYAVKVRSAWEQGPGRSRE